eukprot:TRINITY_DN22639_c0_g1_i3.p1 TRINITY_DN22639_c0_g1~~TRINITY_DN22639_c0_g1_i3.p1  ORF type:complete len:611 (+),score=91.62 TRINITY_DN22639_c0_g1_i3:50-1882(+)
MMLALSVLIFNVFWIGHLHRGVSRRTRVVTSRASCSWAKLDTSDGWQCETIKSFSGGMQGNTKLVQLTPPGSHSAFQAVLKEMNSNQNPLGLHSLENERQVVKHLMSHRFSVMPQYLLDLRVEPQYIKYQHADNMTLAQKDQCDNRLLNSGVCTINGPWDQCNGNRGNIRTDEELHPTKRLKCPDTQLLAMEFLDGYQDLKGIQSQLKTESPFEREVRAAALFLAYDQLSKAGVSHCDFNPGNVMFKVDDPRVVKIIDFGLARLNDHPIGACRGNLEDIGTPGFLWLSVYRGGINELDFQQNDRRAGPLSLSTGKSFKTPSGQTLKAFSEMDGKFNGLGGRQPWNRETRENWPAIVAYAKMLMREADPSIMGDAHGKMAAEKDAAAQGGRKKPAEQKEQVALNGRDAEQKKDLKGKDGKDAGVQEGQDAQPKEGAGQPLPALQGVRNGRYVARPLNAPPLRPGEAKPVHNMPTRENDPRIGARPHPAAPAKLGEAKPVHNMPTRENDPRLGAKPHPAAPGRLGEAKPVHDVPPGGKEAKANLIGLLPCKRVFADRGLGQCKLRLFDDKRCIVKLKCMDKVLTKDIGPEDMVSNGIETRIHIPDCGACSVL